MGKNKEHTHSNLYRAKRQRHRLKKIEARVNRKRRQLKRHQQILSGEYYANRGF